MKENSSAVEGDENTPPGNIHAETGAWAWISDQEGIYTFCSPQVLGHLQVPGDKFLGQSLFTFRLHPESSSALMDELKKDVYPLELETRFQSSEGGWVDVRMHIFCLRGEEDTLQEWFGFNLLLPADSDARPEDFLRAAYQATLTLAVEMIGRGLKLEARKLLQVMLKSNPHNAETWIWFAETFSSDADQLRIMNLYLEKHPQSRFAKNAVAVLQKKLYKQEMARLLALHKEWAAGDEIMAQPVSAEPTADLAALRATPVVEDEFAGAGIAQGKIISQGDMQKTGKRRQGQRQASDYISVILAVLTILITILLAITWAIVR
ncbi:MAG: PAS domain-containing protein [Anaerolineaceae bacterium]|nr:PAS domain-containing protein [Anaerolineaceae bacterium]